MNPGRGLFKDQRLFFVSFFLFPLCPSRPPLRHACHTSRGPPHSAYYGSWRGAGRTAGDMKESPTPLVPQSVMSRTGCSLFPRWSHAFYCAAEQWRRLGFAEAEKTTYSCCYCLLTNLLLSCMLLNLDPSMNPVLNTNNCAHNLQVNECLETDSSITKVLLKAYSHTNISYLRSQETTYPHDWIENI